MTYFLIQVIIIVCVSVAYLMGYWTGKADCDCD